MDHALGAGRVRDDRMLLPVAFPKQNDLWVCQRNGQAILSPGANDVFSCNGTTAIHDGPAES